MEGEGMREWWHTKFPSISWRTFRVSSSCTGCGCRDIGTSCRSGNSRLCWLLGHVILCATGLGLASCLDHVQRQSAGVCAAAGERDGEVQGVTGQRVGGRAYVGVKDDWKGTSAR